MALWRDGCKETRGSRGCWSGTAGVTGDVPNEEGGSAFVCVASAKSERGVDRRSGCYEIYEAERPDWKLVSLARGCRVE
jgi:hypothetical protein